MHHILSALKTVYFKPKVIISTARICDVSKRRKYTCACEKMLANRRQMLSLWFSEIELAQTYIFITICGYLCISAITYHNHKFNIDYVMVNKIKDVPDAQ